MNLSKKLSQSNDSKANFVIKATTLNPNAAEFVPSSHRLSSPSGSNVKSTDSAVQFGNSENLGKAFLGSSESSVSYVSDEEARQFWNQQLPDDITPDFKIINDDESQGIGAISLSSLSLNDNTEIPIFPTASGSEMRFTTNSKLWDKQYFNSDQLLGNGNENSSIDGSDMNLLEFLASQFPGFAAESLAQVYFANGYDLNLTIEMLTQLELQVDVENNQAVTSKGLPSPTINSMEFPALSANESQNGMAKYNGDDLHQTGNPYRAPDQDHLLMFKSGTSFVSRGATDFAAAVRKPALQDPGMWQYEGIGSSRPSHVRGGGSYSGRGVARGAPVWVETGEAVANMYSDLREEARDHARARNAYLEQARQAYLIGNKALAKELSAKGQMHNMQMKAAHGKAQESIYRQRNPEIQANGRGVERMIDLHGLHVNEAIHVLKHELNTLRNTARLTDQRLQVYILVGTGHHTKGARTPARLPVAVQRYLLEEEGVDFTEPQPGLLRIVVH